MLRHPVPNVLIASPAEAAAGALAVPADGLAGAILNWIDDQSVAALCYALWGRQYDPGQIDPSILGDHDLVYTYSEMHGGWLFRFPDAVVKRLSRLEASGFEAVVDRWDPAFRDYGPPPDRAAVAEMLRQLVVLARAVGRDGKPLHWLAPDC